MRALAMLCLTTSLIIAGCGAMTHSEDANEHFRLHVAHVFDQMWPEFPEFAIRAGNYKYADRLSIPNQARRDRSVAFYDRQLAALASFDPAGLSPSNRVDQALMRNYFARARWSLVTFREWQWNPSAYNVGHGIDRIVNTEFASIDARLRVVLARLENVPAYYAAAKASISDPTLEHTQLAILQNRGALTVFGPELMAKVDASKLSASEKALFARRVDAARASIDDFIGYLGTLEQKLKAGPARSFRIGKALYEQKFAYEIQSSFTAEQIHGRALADVRAMHDAMETLARQLWPKYMGTAAIPADRLVMIRSVLDELAKHHMAREDFVDTIRRHMPRLEAFVREKDLLDQDPTRPLVVRETPMYMRGGGALASVSAPGPFDSASNTYYNATPLDGFSAEAAESYLREYNDWTIQILDIHEGIPGHYTQLMHANKSPSLVKSIFGNGSMIEGWAVYGEKMMMDAGYGNGAPEMWLSWMKWNLRAVMNTVIDYEIQTMNLSREDTIAKLTREAFQQQTEATEKWRRATLSQVQLASYFNGYTEITALRDEIRAKQGGAFSVKAFNNQFLSYGSAPVKLIRELMLAGR
jgi:uncharacterized protein (DUF885 family)